MLVGIGVWWSLRPVEAPPPQKVLTYQVQTGETLADLANRFTLSPENLTSRNGLTESAELVPGRLLHLSEPPRESGQLVLQVVPWATIHSVVRKGEISTPVLEGKATTPVILTLPPGRYQITASNEELGGDNLVFETEVKAGARQLENRRWPGFDLETELDEVLGVENDEETGS